MAEARDDEFSRYAKEARPALRRAAYLLSSDWHEAEDLVQRALIAIHRRWDSIERRDQMAGYARAVMLRLLISDRRAHRWTREVLHDLPPEPDPGPDPYAYVLDRLVLMNALAALGPRQREAVVLRYWEDRSVEETACVMGSEGSTVRSQTVRALAALRAALEAEISGDNRPNREGKAEDAPNATAPGP